MLKNLSIRSKLLLISVIPLFVLAYFVTDSLVSYLDRRENSIKVSQEFEQVEKISEVVHQLQIERGMTFGYAVTKRQEFYQQLSQQRNFTDKAISDLKEFLQMHKRILNANPFLDSIPRFRNNYISYTD